MYRFGWLRIATRHPPILSYAIEIDPSQSHLENELDCRSRERWKNQNLHTLN
ncbi:MAG: hypothetical protein QOE96_4306 [Blastocatellia bacterium]|nr:hypothetical protein [Blastocatellia bacterium]